jgi:DNA-binding NarL/FixJ family response regulator
MHGVSVLIVNGERMFREALRALLNGRTDLFVVGEVCDYGDAMNVAASQDIDVVVLDLAVPGKHPTEMIRELKALRPAMRILILSAHFDFTVIANAIAHGANGFLTTECALEEMVSAIHHIAAGRRYIDPNLAHAMAVESIQTDAAGLRPLQGPLAPSE